MQNLGFACHCWKLKQKSFWDDLSQDQVKNKILCHTCSISNSFPSKTISFLCIQITHIITYHPTGHHSLDLTPKSPFEFCHKCASSDWGRAIQKSSKLYHLHQSCWVIVQVKNMWDVSSTFSWQNAHNKFWSWRGICLLDKFNVDGILSQNTLQSRNEYWVEFLISTRFWKCSLHHCQFPDCAKRNMQFLPKTKWTHLTSKANDPRQNYQLLLHSMNYTIHSPYYFPT